MCGGSIRKTSCRRHDGTVDWQVSPFGQEYMKIFRLPLVSQYPVGTIPAEICQENISRFRRFTYDGDFVSVSGFCTAYNCVSGEGMCQSCDT